MNPLTILIASIFTHNIALVYILGMCPFIVISRSYKTAMGMGVAIIFVVTLTAAINWPIYWKLLVPMHSEILSFLIFIIVIAATVQLLEMIIEKFFPAFAVLIRDIPAVDHGKLYSVGGMPVYGPARLQLYPDPLLRLRNILRLGPGHSPDGGNKREAFINRGYPPRPARAGDYHDNHRAYGFGLYGLCRNHNLAIAYVTYTGDGWDPGGDRDNLSYRRAFSGYLWRVQDYHQ